MTLNDSLSSKEFLILFDVNSKLDEIWIDTAMFRMFNKLRDDLARR